MSATLYYQPVTGKRLTIGAPSSFMEAIHEAFFAQQPWELTGRDISTLYGLKAGLNSLDQKAAIQELIDALAVHDPIRVWAEY